MSDGLPDIPGYDVELDLGRGGMGVVYRVRRHKDGTVLALKMMLRGRGASFADLARFRIEAEALACLNHPNIVKIRDVGLYAGYPYFAIDFAEQGSLKQAVSRGPQKPRQAAELVRTLAAAMQHAHERGMLHRDLKPANVLLMRDGTPVITDFGLVKFANPVREVSEMYRTMQAPSLLDCELARLARELGSQYRSVADAPALSEDAVTRSFWDQCATRTGVLDDGMRFEAVREFLTTAKQQAEQPAKDLDGLTQAGTVMGSPNYMAPEQAAGDLAAIGPRTDVYALGGNLYELLTGQPPFRAGSLFDLLSQACSTSPTPPRQLVRGVSTDIEAVCLKCLEKAPDSRYQSAAALAEDLARFIDGYSPQSVVAAGTGTRPLSSVETSEVPSTVPPSADMPRRGPDSTRSWWPIWRRRP
jgi:serine/threonine protein kinase